MAQQTPRLDYLTHLAMQQMAAQVNQEIQQHWGPGGLIPDWQYAYIQGHLHDWSAEQREAFLRAMAPKQEWTPGEGEW